MDMAKMKKEELRMVADYVFRSRAAETNRIMKFKASPKARAKLIKATIYDDLKKRTKETMARMKRKKTVEGYLAKSKELLQSAFTKRTGCRL